MINFLELMFENRIHYFKIIFKAATEALFFILMITDRHHRGFFIHKHNVYQSRKHLEY